MFLSDLKINDIGFVNSITSNSKLSKRLQALGCIKGTKIQLKRIAPLGDPLIISLRGFDLAIRKKDAKKILLDGKGEN